MEFVRDRGDAADGKRLRLHDVVVLVKAKKILGSMRWPLGCSVMRRK